MRDMDMLSNGGEREKTYSSNLSCTSCFDNEKKIDEINAENISNIIFQEESIVKKWIDSDGIRTPATEVTGD